MSKQKSSGKALIITDDEEVQAEELNPFSFREFLRWKNQEPEMDQDQDEERTHIKSSSSHRLLTFDPEVRSCFFSQPSLAPQEEEDWGQSFQSGVDSTSSLCTEDEDEEETRFSSKPEGAAGGGGGENYEGDDETSIAEPVTSVRRRSGRSSQIQELKEENMSLRRTIVELQRSSEANERRVLELSEELLLRRRQEEKEAQDLESMVHSVEQNLHLMTKRAVKAESSVSKLKAELQLLQVEAESLRLENDSLKAAESDVVMAMRHNAQVASEYLNKMASHAHSSIRVRPNMPFGSWRTPGGCRRLRRPNTWQTTTTTRASMTPLNLCTSQESRHLLLSALLMEPFLRSPLSQLLGEADTLRLVSQLLKSIDKISNLDPES